MNNVTDWWERPRKVSIVIDNDEWMLAHCEELVTIISNAGDHAYLCRSYEQVETDGIAIFLSCYGIASSEILKRNHRNLVIHASNLPEGRGWSPLTWQILEGQRSIPVCLLEAGDAVDSGKIIYKDYLEFEGHELINEMREALATLSCNLCLRFLDEDLPPKGEEQQGKATYFSKRKSEDSQLDVNKTIAEQINLLRVVDNDRYPAFFKWQDHSYRIRIEKIRTRKIN